MTQLFDPEDRVAFLGWCYRAWGMETPVSGDTLAMHDRAKAEPYFGGVLDETGFHRLNRANPGNSGSIGVNSAYPAAMK